MTRSAAAWAVLALTGLALFGWLNDANGASAAHPAGYLPMIEFFGVLSLLAVVFAALFWRYRATHAT